MSEKKISRYTVTAALPYANGPLHIGHLAGVYVPADLYARYLRLSGREVLFVCGSDEHGVAITIKARQEGLSPQQLVDRYHEQLKAGIDQMKISVDVYSRTSLPVHHETAREFFLRFHEKGLFTEQTTEQFFDPEAGLFLADRYVTGTCPKCGYGRAYGDQCESCGTSLSPADLIDPKSALTGATPEVRATKHWFLPMQDYQKTIEKYILEDHADWKPNVYGQCKSWLQDGLQARAMTRDMDWGVPVPLAEAEGKVLYVWFDAPIGYISASKHWARDRAAQDPDRFSPDDWKPWWQAPDTQLVHFIGKDNIVFHCIIFPILLMGHGDYIWADQVPANEFLNLEGQKISTSRNWAVWAHEFLAENPDQVDVLRFVLTSIMPETKDNDFTWADYQARNNNELVAIFGNFVHRILTLIHKYYGGVVPEKGTLTPLETELLAEIPKAAASIGQSIEKYRFREALHAAMDLARAGNKYLAETEPWKLHKTDPEATKTVLYAAAQVVAALGVAFEPFTPVAAEAIREMLGRPAPSWAQLQESELTPAGTTVAEVRMLFRKLEDDFVQRQLDKLNASRQQEPAQEAPAAEATAWPPPVKASIGYEQFEPLDLRVATITAAERVPKADKLLKLTLDAGTDVRTVVSGIAEHFAPEDVVGRQVVLLANLAPRKLRGVESQGMILMAEDAEGRLSFVKPDAALPNGAGVR